ncbi:hypothetical protein ACFFX0_05180 [Citricoccus parietis]|uniref:Uncharacterized protein n=1 Tax=Citricoccus parietis TaxID=592307 RepID=A0ABV5FVF1_9MICC
MEAEESVTIAVRPLREGGRPKRTQPDRVLRTCRMCVSMAPCHSARSAMPAPSARSRSVPLRPAQSRRDLPGHPGPARGPPAVFRRRY